MTKKKIGIILGVGIIFVAVLFVAQRLFFAAPQVQEKNEVFTVGLKQDEAQILDKLKSQGFIRNKPAFNFVLSINRKHDAIHPGGYNISKNMDAWQLAEKLTDKPDMKWVVIPEGWRKEQIGEKLADTFGWSNEEIDKWNTEYTKMRIDYIEGTYFPDTYLIPVNEGGFKIAERMTRNFDEKFAPYIGQFAEQNIVWTTGLKLASIIQREAAGKDDMPLIAGIIWNRLNDGMNLEIDATVQYARGKTDTGWRIGAMAGSPDFIADIAEIKGNTDSGFFAPAAQGVITALETDQDGIEACRNVYANRIGILTDMLGGEFRLRLAVEPKAGFFTLWEAPRRAFDQDVESAEVFNNLMIDNTGIVGVPFGQYIRYAVTSPIEEPEWQAAIREGFKKASIAY